MPTDLLLDSNSDILIANGDFVIGESTKQHQLSLLVGNKGEYKQYPKVGVGINGYLLDENEQDMLREIRSQFESDGMTVKKTVLKDSELIIDAPYSY